MNNIQKELGALTPPTPKMIEKAVFVMNEVNTRCEYTTLESLAEQIYMTMVYNNEFENIKNSKTLE